MDAELFLFLVMLLKMQWVLVMIRAYFRCVALKRDIQAYGAGMSNATQTACVCRRIVIFERHSRPCEEC